MKTLLLKPQKWFVLLCAYMSLHLVTYADIRYVDHTATGSNNGSTWANAYTSLAEALKQAHNNLSIDSILVAQGTYIPEYATPPTDAQTVLYDQDKTFYIVRDNIKVLGGYPTGGGTRNAELHTTTLSGRLNANDSAFSVLTIIGSSRNSLPLVYVDGFTITGGRGIYQGITTVAGYDLPGGSTFYRRHGCGIQVDDSSPNLSNLIITGNRGHRAGGAHIQFAAAKLSNLIITNNVSNDNGGLLLNDFYGSIDQLTISSNTGGATGVFSASFCNFIANNLKVIGNTSGITGIIYQYGSTSTYNNLVVTGNRIGNHPIIDFASSRSNNISINNATIAGNYTLATNLISHSNNTGNTYTYNNCNIYGNSVGIASSPNVTMTNSNIQRDYIGTNITNVNPLFINPKIPADAPTINGDYRLNYCSPLLNVGDNSLLHSNQTSDAQGLTRNIGGLVDVGAYEKQSNLANFNNNVSLSNATSNNIPFIATCEEGGFTYYVNPNNVDSIAFGINWGANNAAAKAAAKVYINVNTSSHLATNNTDEAIVISPRYWNVDIGNANLQSPVTVRFYFSETDTTMMRSAINGANVGASSDLVWFKTTNVAYHDNLVTSNAINNGGIIKLPATYGVVGNLKYAEFSNINSFSGGTAMMATLDNEILPLTLLSFQAIANTNRTTTLKWNTAQERDVKSITVERSVNGTDWETVTEVAPKGGIENVYQIIDFTPLKGMNMYRLQIQDLDASVSYSPIETVHFDIDKATLHLYPNPTSGIVNIEGLQGDESIAIMDMFGKISSVTLSAKEKPSLDLGHLPSGAYMIRITNSFGHVVYLKIVKQ